jgi:hypothetical protein
MSEHNWDLFSDKIKETNIRGLDINEKWSNLCNDVKLIINESFPEKLRNVNYKFTMSQGLLKSKNKKK